MEPEKINGRTPKEIKIGLRNMLETCADVRGCDDVLCRKMCCPYDGDESCHETILMGALALIERLESERDAALAKVPKWIKLTEDDRPPDGYYNVMVKKRGVLQRDLLRYDANDDDWWKELSTHDELVPGYLITHWMPLPSTEGLK